MKSRVSVTENCYIDLEKNLIVGDEGQTEALTPLQWKLLKYLAEHPGIPLSLESISKYLYGVSDEHYKTQIRKFKTDIKKNFLKVGLKPNEFDNMIQTRRGHGYVFHPHMESIPVSSDAIGLLKQVDALPNDLPNMVDCMLYQGLSGKMGRHTLMKLAENGNAFAMFEIGELYYYGYCTENRMPDFKTAHGWYSCAAEKNHPAALWSLGYMIVCNHYPQVPEEAIDYGKALRYFTKALSLTEATGGSPAALTSIGKLWYEGHYPCVDFDPNDPQKRRFEKSNVARAIDCYKRADKQGYHYATNRLALHYEKNNRLKEAFDMYLRSSQLVADGYTYNKLGRMLEYGQGCAKNIVLACEYYLKSVEGVMANDITPWGLFNAGRVYANAIPSQPERYLNLKHAFDLFSRAMLKLPVCQHDKILAQMLEIILYRDISSLPPEDVREISFRTELKAEKFLREAKETDDALKFKRVAQIKQMLEKLKEGMNV